MSTRAAERPCGSPPPVPGTHRRPRAELALPGGVRPAADAIVTLRLRRGDVLLRDGNMLHRGTPHRAGAPRPLLDRTYHRTTLASRARRWRRAAGRLTARLRGGGALGSDT